MKTLFALAVLSLPGCQRAPAPEAQTPGATPAFKSTAVPTNVSEAPTSVASRQAAPQETEAIVSSRAPQRTAASVVQRSEGDSPKLRPSYDQCISAAGSVMPSMHDCINAEYRFQDARLNSAYKALMAKLGGKEQTKLRDAQRRWIAQRDEQCASDPDSGQAGALDAYECRLEMTANRAVELESR